VSLYFVYRSFYGMRIGAPEEAEAHARVAALDKPS